MAKPSTVARWAYDLGTSLLINKQIISVLWQGFQVIGSYNLPIIRYTFHSSVNLSTITAGNALITTTCVNPNNGNFEIVNIDDTNHFIEVVNFTRNNNSADETSLTTSYADFYTRASVINVPTSAKMAQGYKSPEKPADGLLNWILNNHGEWINWINTAFSGFVIEIDTIDLLRALNVLDIGNGALYFVKNIDAIYRYNSSLTSVNDGEFYVTPLVGTGTYEKFIATSTDIQAIISAEMDVKDKKIRDLVDRLEILEGV